MSKYKTILQEIKKLQAQAEQERKKEIANVVADIKAKMAEYGITPQDLGFGGGRGSRGSKSKGGSVPAKYRDPATGAEWSGRGRAPKWVTEAEARGVKRETFRIG